MLDWNLDAGVVKVLRSLEELVLFGGDLMEGNVREFHHVAILFSQSVVISSSLDDASAEAREEADGDEEERDVDGDNPTRMGDRIHDEGVGGTSESGGGFDGDVGVGIVNALHDESIDGALQVAVDFNGEAAVAVIPDRRAELDQDGSVSLFDEAVGRNCGGNDRLLLVDDGGGVLWVLDSNQSLHFSADVPFVDDLAGGERPRSFATMSSERV